MLKLLIGGDSRESRLTYTQCQHGEGFSGLQEAVLVVVLLEILGYHSSAVSGRARVCRILSLAERPLCTATGISIMARRWSVGHAVSVSGSFV